MNDKDRSFSRDEIASAVGRVAKAQSSEAGFHRDEALEIAREIGIDPPEMRKELERPEPYRTGRIETESVNEGLRLSVTPPGPAWTLVGRGVIFVAVTAFAGVALVQSGFSVIAWLGTLPFLVLGGWQFFRNVLYAATKLRIVVDNEHFVVETLALGVSAILEGKTKDLHVIGPVVDGDPSSRSGILPVSFLRFSRDGIELDVGHGLNDSELHHIVRQLKPLIAERIETKLRQP